MGFTIKRDGIKGLCQKCDHLSFTRFDNGDVKLRCRATSEDAQSSWIHRPVVECSRFDPVNAMDLWEMKQMAWILETTKRGVGIGFKPPKNAEAANDILEEHLANKLIGE